VRDYRQERTTRAASKPLRITGICINCLRGYATVATGSERPPACHGCGEPVRELLEPLALDKFSGMPDDERQWLRMKRWPKGHAVVSRGTAA
jgi:hypothetical protein